MKLEEQALQFRSEIARLQDQVRKAEARNEAAKAADKTEMVTSLQKVKKLEVQVRELKAKAQQAENLLAKKDREVEMMRAADDKRKAAEDAYTIRDRQTFENHFGHKARPSEEKYVIFLRMYEN